MVPVTKKVSLGGRERPDETEDRSENYDYDSSDESIGEETANVSDYEGDNPKEAPDVCAFGEDNCRKVFQLKGDAKNGLERVCGGLASSCTRTGHGEESRARGPVGLYDVIRTVRKVDGILATHRTKEAAAAIHAESKVLRDSHLSILKGSPGYQATLTMVDQELGATGDDDTFAILGEWENLGGEDQKMAMKEGADRKPPPTDRKSKARALRDTEARSNRTDRKLELTTPKEPDTSEGTNQALIDILLTLTDKVDAMEKWTLVQEKKRRTKKADSEDEASDGEETDDTVAEPTPREPRGQGKRRETDAAKSRTREKEPTKPEPRRKKDKKYYAVARGVTPGVYTTWTEARGHVDGFRNAMHRSFKSKAKARQYVEDHRDPQAGDDSDDDDDWASNPSSSDSEAPPTKDPPQRRRAGDKTTHPSTEYMTPDPSMGKPKEFFGMAVADEKAMIKAMSPPGVDDETTRKLLAGATLDAVQLPGRFNTTAEDGPSSVAEAIAELAEDKRGEWAGDGFRRDVQWKSAKRTSLKTITSRETLQERHTELQGLKGDVYENQVNAYRAILSDLHWSEASIIAWSQLNWYQRIGNDTFEYYTNLHLHLIELSLKQGWSYAAISLAHHTSKLANIRAQAPSRLCCLVRIYIYLRDANRQSFYSEKLQEKRNREVMEEISSLKALGGGSGSGGGGVVGSGAPCKKCGSTLHPGGKNKCPFKSLSDAEARKKAKALVEQLGNMSDEAWAKLLEAGE